MQLFIIAFHAIFWVNAWIYNKRPLYVTFPQSIVLWEGCFIIRLALLCHGFLYIGFAGECLRSQSAIFVKMNIMITMKEGIKHRILNFIWGFFIYFLESMAYFVKCNSLDTFIPGVIVNSLIAVAYSSLDTSFMLDICSSIRNIFLQFFINSICVKRNCVIHQRIWLPGKIFWLMCTKGVWQIWRKWTLCFNFCFVIMKMFPIFYI